MNKRLFLQLFVKKLSLIFNKNIKHFCFLFFIIHFFSFSSMINAARTNCTNVRVISTGSCSNCRVSRRMCGTCDITSTVFGVTTTKRSNICWTDFVTCCTNVCAGPCPTCSYGSSGTYVCGDCSCAKTCNRCCSAPTCNSGETKTSSPYGASCNATTVSRSNGCGKSVDCYTYKPAAAGVCNSGDFTNAASCTLGVESSYTVPGSCGGTTTTCYKCSTQTCSTVNLLADGSPDCRYCLDKADPQCPAPSPTPVPISEEVCTTKPDQEDSNKCVLSFDGTGQASLSCSTITSNNPYVFYQGNDSGDGSHNYRPLSCAEISAQYKTAAQCSNEEIPILVDNLCNGDSYFNGLSDQCTICLSVSDPFFQIVNGSLYAKGTIESGADLSQVTVMRSDSSCATDSANLAGVGIPVAGNKVINISSQINNNVTADFTNGFASIDPEDYRFFSRSLGYLPEELSTNLEICSDLNSNSSSDFTFKDSLVCFIQSSSISKVKLSNYLADLSENAQLIIPAGVRKVVFVDGDIEIDREIILEKSLLPDVADGFLMFVVSGNIEISSYLGDFLTTANFTSIGGSCASQDPSLHGIFIANGTINFISGGVNNAFTNSAVNRNCDKKITVAGSFIGWGKNETNQPGITMSRTFAGCVPGSFQDSTVPNYVSFTTDYNATTPVITFIYDNKLINNIPNWVNKSIWSRYEVQ